MNTVTSESKKKLYLYVALSIVVLVCILGFLYLKVFSSSSLAFEVVSEENDGRTFEVLGTTEGFGNEPEGWANLEINPSYSFGVRFINISLPRGSRVIDAYVRLYSIGLPNRNDHVSCVIYGDDVDSSDDFYTKGCLERCGRVYTTNFVLWDAVTPFNQWVQTPSLARIIQEIVQRPGWEAGHSISLLFITQHTNNTAVFNNFELGNSAQFVIIAHI